MKTIQTDNAPKAIGPYSQAKAAGGFLWLSGQIAINPASGKIEATDIAGQTEQVCRNIEALLVAADADMNAVVKTTCFLANIEDFQKFNEVYAEHFTSKPARSCVAVKALPAGALCEIEVIAKCCKNSACDK